MLVLVAAGTPFVYIVAVVPCSVTAKCTHWLVGIGLESDKLESVLLE